MKSFKCPDWYTSLQNALVLALDLTQLFSRYAKWLFSGLLTEQGKGKKFPLPNICYTYLSKMQLCTNIPNIYIYIYIYICMYIYVYVYVYTGGTPSVAVVPFFSRM